MGVSPTLTLRRLGYRVAYRGLQVFWFITRPTKRGVKCVVTDRDRVLLVRHTYGRRCWDFPGGSMKRRESALSAARREMSEELGLDGADWGPIGEFRGRVDRRHDSIQCFRVELHEPDLRIDLGELATAQWFARDRLPADVSPYVGAIIDWAPEIADDRDGESSPTD
jgi:8-oxo-dGTP pyrophosphatase MutT (NUDIX family)